MNLRTLQSRPEFILSGRCGYGRLRGWVSEWVDEAESHGIPPSFGDRNLVTGLGWYSSSANEKEKSGSAYIKIDIRKGSDIVQVIFCPFGWGITTRYRYLLYQNKSVTAPWLASLTKAAYLAKTPLVTTIRGGDHFFLLASSSSSLTFILIELV